MLPDTSIFLYTQLSILACPLLANSSAPSKRPLALDGPAGSQRPGAMKSPVWVARRRQHDQAERSNEEACSKFVRPDYLVRGYASCSGPFFRPRHTLLHTAAERANFYPCRPEPRDRSPEGDFGARKKLCRAIPRY